MPAVDSSPDVPLDTRTRGLFFGVFVCEALTIAALWAFGRYFS
jgi:hypothetical protein